MVTPISFTICGSPERTGRTWSTTKVGASASPPSATVRRPSSRATSRPRSTLRLASPGERKPTAMSRGRPSCWIWRANTWSHPARSAMPLRLATSLVRAMAGNAGFPTITGWMNWTEMCWASVLPAPLPNAMSLPPPPNLAAMSAAVAVTASAHSTRARPASRRRAKASATALEATDPDRAPSMPFTDAPPAHASEKTTSATPRGGDRVARRAKQKKCLMLARKQDACSRSCVLFGGHVSQRTGSKRPGNFYLEVRTDYRGRGSSLPLLRRPAILAGEEPADEPDLVDEEQAEAHAQHSRREGQRTMENDEAPCREGEGHGNGDGDDHHAHDGTDPEDEQVGDGGERLPDAREYEQSHGGRTGQPVDHAHHERAEDLVEAESA